MNKLLKKMQKKFGYKIDEAYMEAIIPAHMILDKDQTKPTDTINPELPESETDESDKNTYY